VLTLNGTFLIEAEDFNFGSGQIKPVVNTMPYTGNAYSGVSAKLNVDYATNDGDDSKDYRATAVSKGGEKNKDMNDNLGGRAGKTRGGWDMTANFKLGWTDTADWMNYTRAFPASSYAVFAALSHGDGPGATTAMRGTLDLVTAGATTANQTTQALGKFVAPGSGGWGRNEYVRMTDAAGSPNVIDLSGDQTVRFTADSGDFDYLLFVPSGGVQPEGPKFSSITKNDNGSITIVWEGGGTLQAAESITGPWQDVPGAASPYTTTPTQKVLFARIKK